jgi:hypothetical protein
LSEEGEEVRRAFAVLLLLWGVATIMAAGVNVVLGTISTEEFVAALVGGGILLSIAWWLDRSRKKKATTEEISAHSPGSRESAAPDNRPCE